MSDAFYKIKILKKNKETSDCFSFTFSVPEKWNSLFQYFPAQFLTFQFEIEGKSHVRSYSLSSSPFLNEDLKTAVKRVSGGVISNHMVDSLKEGDEILSQVPQGAFYKPPKNLDPHHYVLFGAGIGITPLFSILKTILDSSASDKVLLVYSNKNPDAVIFKDELNELEKKYPEQLRVKHIFSEKEGRLNESHMSEVLNSLVLKEALFYLCGPKEYMKGIKKFLIQNQVKEDQVHTEDFKVVPVRYPQPDEDSIFLKAPLCEKGEPETLKANIDGENHTISLNREKSLLEQLLDKGLNVPFSCTSGNCMTCMAKLKEGEVFQIEEGILDEENRENMEILTCQSYPLSKKVAVDFDDF